MRSSTNIHPPIIHSSIINIIIIAIRLAICFALLYYYFLLISSSNALLEQWCHSNSAQGRLEIPGNTKNITRTCKHRPTPTDTRIRSIIDLTWSSCVQILWHYIIGKVNAPHSVIRNAATPECPTSTTRIIIYVTLKTKICTAVQRSDRTHSEAHINVTARPL